MNVVKGLLEEPFFTHAKFHWQDAHKESLTWAEKWEANREAVVRVEKEKQAKKRGRKPTLTAEQKRKKLNAYQREYQRKYREKQKAQKMGLQQFEIVNDKWANPSEALKNTSFAKQQRARKEVLIKSVKAKMAALSRKKRKSKDGQ